MSGLRYVYAVCRPFGTPLPAQLTGVGGLPPKKLVHRDLVALVGQVPEEDFAAEPLRVHLEDPDWLAATARAHRNVVDGLTVVTSPLPLRPATVFRDDSAVRTMMEEREETFLRTLDRLEGRVEWGVKVYAQPTDADGASQEKWEGAEQFASRLHASLSGHAEDTRMHDPRNGALSRAPGRNVLDAAYLVPRTESEAFVELVDRTKDDAPGLSVELTGPWAAYSFSGEDT